MKTKLVILAVVECFLLYKLGWTFLAIAYGFICSVRGSLLDKIYR